MAAGDDYVACDAPPDRALGESWEVLKEVLEDASERLTQQQILAWWPQDFRKPDVGTISRALARSLEQGLTCRNGTGRRNDPYRYWLPGLEAQLHPDPGARPQEMERWRQHWQEKSMRMVLDLGSGLPAESPATASVPAEPQPEAVVEAPVVAATQAAADRGVSEPPSVSPCEGATGDRSAELPVGGPAAPVVVELEPIRPTPPSKPVSPSLAAPALVLSPIAIPTKEETELAAEVDRERRRLRRWPSG